MKRTHLGPILALLPCVLLLRGVATPGERRGDPALLSIERIYASGELSAATFGARWVAGGGGYTRLEASKGPAGGRDIVLYTPASGERRILVPAEDLVPPGADAPLAIEDHAWSAKMSRLLVYTNARRVWRRKTRGDYWVLDRSSRELRKLGGDAPPSTLMFAKFSPDGRRVAYVRENDIWVEDLTRRTISRLTRDGSRTTINGTGDWVYEEELGLRDGFRWSPDGKAIAYWQIDDAGVREFTLVDNTGSLYPRLRRFAYPKAGEMNPACRVGVVRVETGKTTWLDVPGDPREHYIARMAWARGSDEVVLQRLNRRQNTLEVMLADATSGAVRTVFTDRDECWVDVEGDVRWVEGGKRFLLLSERDGWRHAWLVSRAGDSVRLVTPGDFDIIRVLHIDEQRGILFFLASPENPTRSFLYSVRLDGSGLRRVTPAAATGTHGYSISPDGSWAIHTRSTFDEPPAVDLVRLPAHETVRTLVDNAPLRAKLGALRRRPATFFRVDIGDGVLLDGWRLDPPDLDPMKKYPLLVYVYGEPAGRTVADRWGGRGYLWHLMLAQKGYIVASVDNRGTAVPRGRAWRKAIYRRVGILAPRDQAAAVRKILATLPYADPARVGVWGWSGGGSMTLNAMFKFPDLYHAGIAIAPVPNQRLYDTIYQERYMGLPEDNVEGFREGSPINFASRLRGKLLLIHGTGDDNCHYQGMEALVNELIEHDRQFAMMAYPNRTHSISEGINTTRHLRELMLRFLLESLPPGPR